ncbi:MAG: zf-HC2 domain-containing protein [Planctomycetes bacterium]|nr:zf-HC2 domain-containing protein [Planctomycetota bacterium]
MNCSDIAEQLPLLLYDELEADEAASVRSHLASCETCAEAWRELQQTRTALDEWSPIETGRDVRELFTDPANANPPVVAGNGWKFKSIITGLAAGFLLMATLFFIGVDIRKDAGRLTISFGRGTIPQEPAEPAVDIDALESRIRLATFEHIDRTTFEFAESLTEYLERWDQLQARQRTELFELLALARQDDIARYEAGLQSVAEGAASDNLITRRAVDELAQLVVFGVIPPVNFELNE